MKLLFQGLLVSAMLPLLAPQWVEAKTLDEKLKERLAAAERLGREADEGFRLNYYNNFIIKVVIEREQAERLIACDDTQENRDYLASLPTLDTKVDRYDDIPEEYRLNTPPGKRDFFWEATKAFTDQRGDFYLINKLKKCERARKAETE